jgi:hypothetical protein
LHTDLDYYRLTMTNQDNKRQIDKGLAKMTHNFYRHPFFTDERMNKKVIHKPLEDEIKQTIEPKHLLEDFQNQPSLHIGLVKRI